MARKAKTFIKQYFFMLALAATFIGFSAFKFASSAVQDDVTLYFHGDPTDADDVKNPSLWTEEPNSETCEGDQLACAMDVDPSDAVGTEGQRELNSATITLDAEETDEGFIPTEGSGTTSPTGIIESYNRD